MSDMTPEELASLYSAPSARVGPEADVAPLPEPPRWHQGHREPSYDPLAEVEAAAARAALEAHAASVALARRRSANEAALEDARFRQAMAQLSGQPPIAPVDLNREHYARRQGFMIGMIVGAVALGAVAAISVLVSKRSSRD